MDKNQFSKYVIKVCLIKVLHSNGLLVKIMQIKMLLYDHSRGNHLNVYLHTRCIHLKYSKKKRLYV